MKRLLFAALLMAACSSAPHEPMMVAEAAYQALIDGRWEDYMAMTSSGDSLPADVLQERIGMLREYMEMEKEAHGGLTSVAALRDTLVGDDFSYVFLEMQWADSVREEVMLPMVRIGDSWKIR